jgi:hypothetical protein
MSTVRAILTDPRFHDYLAILKGARNGLVYGVKIRFPHALLMSLLFGRGECVASPSASRCGTRLNYQLFALAGKHARARYSSRRSSTR